MQTLFAGAWQSQIVSDELMTRTAMLSPSTPQEPLRGWWKGHFPLNTLQGKLRVHPMLFGKGHISFRQLEMVAKTQLCLAEGLAWRRSHQVAMLVGSQPWTWSDMRLEVAP